MAAPSKLSGGLNAAVVIICAIVAVVLINQLSSSLFGRLDLTENNLNVLSDASKEAVAELEDLEVKLYISPDLPNSIPFGQTSRVVQHVPQRLLDKIAEYKSHSPSMVVTRVVDDVVEKAKLARIRPVTGTDATRTDAGGIKFDEYVIGATFHYQGHMEVIELALEPEFYEFEITKRLVTLKAKADNASGMAVELAAGAKAAENVAKCKSALEAAAPDDDGGGGIGFLNQEKTAATLAAYRAAVDSLNASCGSLSETTASVEALGDNANQLKRMAAMTGAIEESYKAFTDALGAQEPQAAMAALGQAQRVIAIADAVDAENIDLKNSPGRSKIGFVTNGLTFAPFPNSQPLVPRELEGALAQKNPILGQVLPQLKQIDSQVNEVLARINQGLFRSQGFDIVDIDLEQPIPTSVRSLVVFGPKGAFSDYQQYQLDQFVMGGGSLVVFVNAWDVEILNLTAKGDVADPRLTANTSNIGDLVAHYGIKPTGHMVMEPKQHDQLVLQEYGKRGGQLFPWQRRPSPSPMLPVLSDLDDSSPLVRAMTSVTLPFPTSLELSGAATPLVRTSEAAVTMNDQAFPLTPREQAARIAAQSGEGPLALVAVVSGELTSAFAGREAPTPATSGEEDAATAQPATPRLDAGSGRVLVVGSNLGLEPLSRASILDGFSLTSLTNDNMEYIQKFRQWRANFHNWNTRIGQLEHTLSGNLRFLTNVLDWSVQRDALAELRSKPFARRPLDKTESGTRTGYQLAAIAGGPLLFLLAGFVWWRLRRRRQGGLRA